MNKDDIHIFIPAFNEEKPLMELLPSIKKEGFKNIHVIDDGSTDSTYKTCISNQVSVLRHPLNRGAGAASQTAIEYAKKINASYMILMDADGQHIPNEISLLIEGMKNSPADIIIGSRFMEQKKNTPFPRNIYNFIGNSLINLNCKKKYTDTQSGFRLLNKKAIHSIQLTLDNFSFCSEMILLAEKKGLQIDEVPITTHYSEYSLSKGQSLGEGIRTIFSYWWKIIYD